MPDVMTDSFLEGQGIPVNLHEIETEMTKLWGPAAEQVGGPELENPHVTRIALANLVVACLDGDGESLGGVLETVIARYPCRAIVVLGSNDPGRRIAAEVSALCHLPAPGLPQVCSERIVLRAGPERNRPAPRRRAAPARGRAARGPLVDRRPEAARGAVPRPGRRMFAVDPRPARPRCRAGTRSGWVWTRPSARSAGTPPGSV